MRRGAIASAWVLGVAALAAGCGPAPSASPTNDSVPATPMATPSVTPSPSFAPSPSTGGSPLASSVAPAELAATVGLTIRLPASVLGPLAVLADGGSVWVARGGETTGTLASFDASDGKPGRTVKVGWAPGYVAQAGDIAWVSDTIGDGSQPASPAQNTVTLVDMSLGTTTATFPVAEPTLLTATGSQAWVLSEGHLLDRLDTSTHAVTQLIDLSTQGQPAGLAIVGQRLWVSLVEPGTPTLGQVLSLDPTSGAIESRLPMPGAPAALAAADGQLMTIIEPPSGDWSLGTIETAGYVPLAALPAGRIDASTLALSPGYAWFASLNTGVEAVDLKTRTLVSADVSLSDQPTALAPAPGAVWVLGSSSLTRLDVPTAP